VNVQILRSAADEFLARCGSLIDEVVAPREALALAQAENLQLRAELTRGCRPLRNAQALVTGAESARRGRGSAATRTVAATARRATGRTRALGIDTWGRRRQSSSRLPEWAGDAVGDARRGPGRHRQAEKRHGGGDRRADQPGGRDG